MLRNTIRPSPARPRTRRNRSARAALALLLPLAATCFGCGDEVNREFRSAALGSIESGVKTIVDGVLTGLFTVATPS